MRKTKLLFLLLFIFLAGCYDRKDINRLEIVVGMGLDLTEDGKIQATVQVLNPTATGGGGGGNGESEPYVQIQSTGQTVSEALRKANLYSPNRLYFAHNRLVIFGEDFAKMEGEGIHHTLDWLIRDEEPRESTFMLICKDKASDMLKTKIPTGPIPAFEITKIIETNYVNSMAVTTTVADFARNLAANIPLTVVGRVDKTKAGDAEIVYSGGALIEGHHFKEYLTETEVRGYNWLTGRFERGLIVATIKGTDHKFTLEVLRSNSGFRPVVLANGDLAFKVQAEIIGRIIKMENSETLQDPYAWSGYNEVFAESVKSEMRSAIHRAQVSGDFLGLANSIKKYLPKTWKQVETTWEDLWRTIPFSFDISIEIHGVGKINTFQ